MRAPGEHDAAGPAGLVLRWYDPPPDVPGLKLDWHSETGRSGVLLDWRSAIPAVDAGVPPDVLAVLSTALAAVGTVCGCTERVPDAVGDTWTPAGDAYVRHATGGWLARPRRLGLLASRAPREVARLFDEAYFDWSQEAQILFVSDGDVLPRLDRGFVERCAELPLAVRPDEVAAAGVSALIRPGVDGDMAGIYAADPNARSVLLEAIAGAVRAAGGRWEQRHGGEHWSVTATKGRGRSARPGV